MPETYTYVIPAWPLWALTAACGVNVALNLYLAILKRRLLKLQEANSP